MRGIRPLVLFGAGGAVYIITELLWRGYSHWTMFIVGGICFVLIGLINEFYTYEMPMVRQMLVGQTVRKPDLI